MSNESLVKKHYRSISKQVHVEKLRKDAVGTKYGHRVNLESLLSRSLSTPTLQYRQARRNSVIAHSKYKRIAVEAMKDPIDRKKFSACPNRSRPTLVMAKSSSKCGALLQYSPIR